MKTSTKKMASMVRQLGLGVGFSVFAAGALAVGPITTFTVEQEFEFTAWSPEGTGTDTTTGVIASGASGADNGDGTFGNVDGATKLAWGDPELAAGLPSSLVINPTGDLNVPSNALSAAPVNVVADNGADGVTTFLDVDFELGPEVVHNNWVIYDPSLETATATDYVTLTANGNTQVQGPMFDILFKETSNALGGHESGGDGTGCPSSYANGTQAWDSLNGCGDIFVLDLTQLVPTFVNEINPVDPANPVIAFLIDSFVIGDYKYDVYLREETGNIAALSNDACFAATGSNDDCIGFVTLEERSTAFQLAFGIVSSEVVPAPATLFLMGGSLLSMAWFRRRRSVKAA